MQDHSKIALLGESAVDSSGWYMVFEAICDEWSFVYLPICIFDNLKSTQHHLQFICNQCLRHKPLVDLFARVEVSSRKLRWSF